jgi:hypothetical protein
VNLIFSTPDWCKYKKSFGSASLIAWHLAQAILVHYNNHICIPVIAGAPARDPVCGEIKNVFTAASSSRDPATTLE